MTEINTINIAGGDVRMIEQDNTVYLAGVDFKQIMNTCSTYFATQCNRLKISPAFKVGVTGYTLISDVIEVFEHLNTSKLTVMQNRESISKILNDLKAIQENLNTVPAVIPTELELTKEMIDYAIDLKISPRDCKRYWDSSIKKQIERHDHPPFSYFKIAIEQIALNRAKLDVARLIVDQTPMLPEVSELKETIEASQEPKAVEMPKTDFDFSFAFKTAVVDGIEQPVISSIELHEKLEVKTDHRKWIERRLSESDAEKNKGYLSWTNLSVANSNNSKARPQEVKEYLLTIPTAKDIAMLERSAIGTKVRKYFRDCESTLEKVVNSQSQVGDQSTSQSIPVQSKDTTLIDIDYATYCKAKKEFKDSMELSEKLGISTSQASINANDTVKKLFRFDFLKFQSIEKSDVENKAKLDKQIDLIKKLSNQNNPNPTQNGLF